MPSSPARPLGGPARASSPAEPQGSRGRLRLILMLGALSAFAPLSIDMYLPALPALTTHFETGASEVQLTLSSFFLGLALGQAILGPLRDGPLDLHPGRVQVHSGLRRRGRYRGSARNRP